MNTNCKDGDRLCRDFENRLREWGWLDAFANAIALMPVGLPTTHEFQKPVERAVKTLLAARHLYVEHMANCLICSRGLVAPGAIAKIMEKLREELRMNQPGPCDIAKGV